MSYQLPSKFDNTWKNWFIRNRYHSLYTKEINHHIDTISSIKVSLDAKRQNLFNKFNDSQFWNNLRQKTGFDAEVDRLHSSWKLQSSFAHLSSQELLKLKDEHLEPLECAILRSQVDLEGDLENYNKHGLWRPAWFIRWQGEAINEIKDKYDALIQFKTQLQTIALIRASLYKEVGQERHCDDVISLMAMQVNKLNVLYPPLDIPLALRNGLDDDTRVSFFDWCATNYPDKREDFKIFTQPINQKPYRPPLSADDVNDENNQVVKFCKIIEARHQLTALSRIKAQNDVQMSEKKWLKEKIFEPTKNFFKSSKIADFMVKSWKVRFLIASILSFGLYFWFSPAIIAASTLYLGQWAGAMVTNILFYGGALLPIWWMGLNCLKWTLNTAYEFCSYWKINEIHQSVEQIKANQKFIASRLSVGVVDIPQFNIEILENTVSARLEKLQELQKSLAHIRTSEKLIMRGMLNQSRTEVIEALKTQEKDLNDRCKLLATHISTRIKDEIQVLEKSNSKNRMTPRIPSNQIAKLKAFVKKYGDEQDLKTFETNSDILSPLLENLEANKLSYKGSNTAFCQEPWGGYLLKTPAIKGWKTLVEGLVSDIEQRKAALSILDILNRQNILEPAELGKLILSIQKNDNGARWIRALQNHIFLNLDHLPSSLAILLDEERKQTIKDWYICHENEINDAYNLFTKIFKNNDLDVGRLTNRRLAEYFSLLDGAEIHLYANNTTRKAKAFRNLAKEYFKKYLGSHDKAIYFTRFVPNHEKQDIICDIANKRLSWFLSNTEQNLEITDADIELFKNPNIFEECSQFSFKQTVLAHPAFQNNWHASMERFLTQCKDYGLDTGGLLKQYCELHQREKDFLSSMKEKAVIFSQRAAQSCGIEAAKSNTPNETANRRACNV
jgi:hypothetical protein|tara:strand:+ start:20545 stop:23241 length:2697 start_codon:yes stop_codon:yes gene_type:complete